LAKIAKDGVALSEEEYEIGVIGSAVPVFDQQRFPVAAMTVVIPTVRATTRHRKHIQKILLAAAKSLQIELGLQREAAG